MIKDIFNKNTNEEDNMNLSLKGKLVVTAEKNGVEVHRDEGDNVVTIFSKHALMHLLTSESFSTHGNTTGTAIKYSGRSSTAINHSATSNIDGTIISSRQYLTDNTNYFDSVESEYSYLSKPPTETTLIPEGSDQSQGFIFPFFPTKMLFGTGKEYKSWADVPVANTGSSSDIYSYQNMNNGSWNESMFDSEINNVNNYYSNTWGTDSLLQTRTVNDISSGVLSESPDLYHFGVSGAIKDATYNNSVSDTAKIAISAGKWFAKYSYRGIGRPSFIYARRGRFFDTSSETALSSINGIEQLNSENRITFTIVMPEQTNGEFYPYNGYVLKQAGLFCDSRMVLGNTIPIASGTALNNYNKMPCGIMWAKRNISPVYKTHDLKIIATWTIYLP